jgi:hemolysin activation/secretion protein
MKVHPRFLWIPLTLLLLTLGVSGCATAPEPITPDEQRRLQWHADQQQQHQVELKKEQVRQQQWKERQKARQRRGLPIEGSSAQSR